jgi:predicted RND superfamily exporter protein
MPDLETGVLAYNDVYFRRLNKLIVTTVASLLPIVAIIVLYAVKSTWRRIYVAIAFTALFGIAMACTNARQSEIFAATAAFAAVEVVFIGSVSGG